MIRQTYVEFVELFGELNPFELAHFSEALFNKFEHLIIEEKQCECKLPFVLQDVEYVMTRAIRDVQIELAETRMDDARIHLEKAKALTFTPRKVTPEDEARVAKRSTRNADDQAGSLPSAANKKQSA